MPKLNNNEMVDLKTSSFVYSGTRLENLGASEYTLVTIAVDTSGSVTEFKTDMENALQEIIKSCQDSPRADNLMIRLVTFNSNEEEEHGFKLLSECNVDDYKNCLDCRGLTALFDATYNSIESMSDYSRQLVENDFDVNGIVFVITDGMDNSSTFSSNQVSQIVKKSRMDENFESLLSVLIGVNVTHPQIKTYLKDFNDEAEFDKYIELENADAKTLSKLAEFVSKSISSQSQSLGTGQAVSLSF